MVKKWRPWTSCTACSSKNTVGCQKLLRRSHKVCLCGLQVGRESPLLCIGNTCELDNWDVHATVLHGDGVEFGAYGPPPRRSVLLLLYSFHPIAEITLKNANIKDEFKGASTRIN